MSPIKALLARARASMLTPGLLPDYRLPRWFFLTINVLLWLWLAHSFRALLHSLGF